MVASTGTLVRKGSALLRILHNDWKTVTVSSALARSENIQTLSLLECAEELPAEESGRIETEEGFRGTRLLMGLPGLVESLTAHAVQSGVVSPNPRASNGMDSTLEHVRSGGNVNVEPTSFQERTPGQQSMEAEPAMQTEAAGERTGSTSGEASADSHPSMAEIFTAPQGSDPSAPGDVTSAEQLEDSDMGTVAEEEGKIFDGRS